MSDAAAPRLRRKKSSPSETGAPAERVGFIMGKLEGIEDRLDQGDIVRERMETKLDNMPGIMRMIVGEAVKPFGETAVDHAARISALEKFDVAAKSSMSTRTKIFGGLVGLAGLGTTVATIWEAFHLGK